MSSSLSFISWFKPSAFPSKMMPCRGHLLTLPLLGLGSSYEGLHSNLHLLANRISPFCWNPPLRPLCKGWFELQFRSVVVNFFRGMINYEMGCSPPMIYIKAKTSPVENIKQGWENDMATNMATFFAKRVL